MLALENIGIEFGGKWLLRNADYQFLPGERVGLIGRNGAGKSTLLRILVDEMTPSEGKVHKAGNMQIAFFSQDLLSFQTDRSIVEVAREAFAPLLALERDIQALLQKIESGESDNTEADLALWDELAQKQARFETQGGNLIDAQVHSVLTGLGFKPEEHDMPFQTFSGGWRMRVLLAKMLLTQPDLLLLDEPTNHLDLPSIQWLESYLKSFKGSCIIVSHDRFFIDRMAQRIVEISLQRLQVYNGNYAFYIKERAIRLEQQQRAWENQQKFIEGQEQFINRFRAKASKAKQVQSKIKQLDKIERLLAPEEERANINMRFTLKIQTGKEVLRLSNISKSYGDKVILDNSDGGIYRGDKIGLIGANGLGKSTLLRIMAQTEPHTGEHKLGYNVIDSFFAQHQLEALNLSNDILKEVTEKISHKTEQEIRNILGAFMFSGEEVEKKIKVLSGGEKSRVALAITLLSEANFLLLDEPTNHLDIPSIQILVDAMNAYEGTYVVVSHDRFFLEKVTNKIWYIEDKQIKEYPGSYKEFEQWKAKQEQQLAEENGATKLQNKLEPPSQKAAPNYKQQKQLRNKLKKLQRDEAKYEEEIQNLEAELKELGEKMAGEEMASDFKKLQEAEEHYNKIQQSLEESMNKWEAVVSELEKLA